MSYFNVFSLIVLYSHVTSNYLDIKYVYDWFYCSFLYHIFYNSGSNWYIFSYDLYDVPYLLMCIGRCFCLFLYWHYTLLRFFIVLCSKAGASCCYFSEYCWISFDYFFSVHFEIILLNCYSPPKKILLLFFY